MKRILIIALFLWLCFRTEIDFGRVIDNEKNGILYNGESYYNYISYSSVDKAKENDIIMTVCILNPLNKANDDVVWRGDIILLDNERR